MRDHRDEHTGCKVTRPWDKWCSKYRYASQLVGYALKDIEGMPEDEIHRNFILYKRGHEVWKSRWYARPAYIALLEGWDERERETATIEADFLMRHAGEEWVQGRDREEAIKDRLFEKRQSVALQVLYAYGMFDPKTGKIDLDRLKKLS